jgi:hypothetical protein
VCKDFTKLKMKYAYNVLYVSFRDTIPYPKEYFLMLQENQWTAVRRAVEWKTCKRQIDDRNWHRFGADLGGSDAFVSRSLSEKLQIVILCSKVLFILEYGERMTFYAFWSSTWPSRLYWI